MKTKQDMLQQRELTQEFHPEVNVQERVNQFLNEPQNAAIEADHPPVVIEMEQLPEEAFAPAPEVQEARRESYSERKKREAAEKQRRKAVEAETQMREAETAVWARREARAQTPNAALSQADQKQAQALLDKRLAAIAEGEKAALLRLEYVAKRIENGVDPRTLDLHQSVESQRLEILRMGQMERANAYYGAAEQMPPGSKVRRELLEKREDAVVRGGRLQREHKVSQMPEGAEKAREAATIKRHAKFDLLKKIFRTPSPYSHEEAEVTLTNGTKLVNVGRATLGGTKAMYVFEERNVQGISTGQEWLFKEATNCIGMAKPEGAVVTGEASKLQHYLRGALSIPAQCLKDGQGKVVGSVQKRMQKAEGGVDLFKWQAQEDLTVNEPSAVTKADLMHEHTLDWILCNFDTKGENFINQPEDHIISFDKEASFNTLLQEESREMSYTFKPHSNDTIYNTMFRAYANGKINLDLDANLESIQKMEQMSGDDFIAMFHETLDTKYGAGTEDRARAEELLRDRHRNLRKTYRTFYTTLIRERLQAIRHPEEREKLQSMLEEGTFVFADEKQTNQADD